MDIETGITERSEAPFQELPQGQQREVVMKQLVKLSLVLTVSMGAYQVSAFAQPKTTLVCNNIGSNAPEVLDSKQGHMLANSNFACRVEGGPFDKGWATGSQVYEFFGPKGTGKAGSGVIRHPEGAAVWVNEVMQNDLQMQEGKVVGFHASGKGKYAMATGVGKDLEGRPYSYVARPTGPGQFSIEVSYEDKK
jgi:hypothetical protein